MLVIITAQHCRAVVGGPAGPAMARPVLDHTKFFI